MKKIILILMMCLFLSKSSFAQNNVEAMRFLTINALMQYGQKLYDRGDFNEATAVFNHVLTYDERQSQALEYLKEMGHSPVSKEIIVIQPLQAKPLVLPHKMVVEEFSPPVIKAVNVLDTESLKKAIEAKRKIVEKLRLQIKQMQANIASQSI